MNTKIKDARKTMKKMEMKQEKMKEVIRKEVKENKKIKKIMTKLEKNKKNEDEKQMKREERKIKFMIDKYGEEREETEEVKMIKEEFKGVKSLDVTYKIREDEEGKEEITVVEMEDEKGQIHLTENEKEILRTAPGFMINQEVKMDEIETEIQVMSTKLRWERRKEVEEDLGDEEIELTEEEEAMRMKVEAEGRMTYNDETKHIVEED